MPINWRWTRLSTIADLYTGNSINEEYKQKHFTGVTGKNYIATKDVNFDATICYDNGVAIPDSYISDFRIAPSGSVLMCIEGGSAGRKIAILTQSVCFGNKLCCFIPYVNISMYLFYYLQSPNFFNSFQQNKAGIIGGASVNTLKNLLIPLPPFDEINRITEQITQISKTIERS